VATGGDHALLDARDSGFFVVDAPNFGRVTLPPRTNPDWSSFWPIERTRTWSAAAFRKRWGIRFSIDAAPPLQKVVFAW